MSLPKQKKRPCTSRVQLQTLVPSSVVCRLSAFGAILELKPAFTRAEMGISNFSIDNTKLAEMEFYLIEELDFHLIIFHPYRSLIQLTGREGSSSSISFAGRASMLEMDDNALQMAWFVINDTFRSSLCLVQPPHLIAIAAIYLAFSLHPPASARITASRPSSSDGPSSRTRRQSIDVNATTGPPPRTGPPPVGGQTDPISFLSTLAVDHSIVLEIVQEIISLYELWNSLDASFQVQTAADTNVSNSSNGKKAPTAAAATSNIGKQTTVTVDEKVVGILARMRVDRQREMQGEREKSKMQAAQQVNATWLNNKG